MNEIKKQLKFLQSYRRVHASVFRAKDVIKEDILARMQGYTQLRTDYVLQENWPIHSSGIDTDNYDQIESTRYVVATTGSRIVAGLRLTPVEHIQESMSFHMWDHATERESFLQQYRINSSHIEANLSQQIFDITRLVTEASILNTRSVETKYDSRAGLMKVLALAATVYDPGKHPLWVFTTTESVLEFMNRNHFSAKILASGMITPGDKYISYLCVVKPHEVISRLKKSNPLLYVIATHQRRRFVQ